MKPIAVLVVVLGLCYFIYLVYERIYHKTIRKSFKHIIHVNGIRGKSTVCRLIDAGLRECGYRVFTKTTGTIPTIITPQNEEIPVKRWGSANIREQLKMLRMAKKANAEVLVIECMAVNPDLQEISQQQILEADIVIITNVRRDHIGEMGENELDIAKAFSRTIPKNGTFIISDDKYLPIYQKFNHQQNANILMTKENNFENVEENYQTFSENLDIALMIQKILDLSEEKFITGMKKYRHDFGAYQELKYQDTIFFNGFAANDITSTMMLYEKFITKHSNCDLTILFSARNDRPARTLEFIDLLAKLECQKIILTGSNLGYIKHKLSKNCTAKIVLLQKKEDLLREKTIFAIGNIKGEGMKIVDYFLDLVAKSEEESR